MQLRSSAIAALGLATLLGVATLLPPAAQPTPAGAQVSGGATLRVQTQPVTVQRAQTGAREPGADGATLEIGDRVMTGAGAIAQLTFFDGSELDLSPEAEVLVQALERQPDGGTLVSIGQALGTTLSRVAKAVTPNSSYVLATSSAVAVVRGTELESTVTREGFQIFRATAGPVQVRAGGVTKVLQPGEMTIVPPLPPATATPVSPPTRGAIPPTPPSASGHDPVPLEPAPIASGPQLLATAQALATSQAPSGGASLSFTPGPSPTADKFVLTPGALLTPIPSPTPTSAASPTPPPTATPTLNWTARSRGFIYGALTANPGATGNLAKAAGFSHMWSYVPWRQIEPRSGQFIFKTKDEWGQTTANDLTNGLNAAKAAGLKFVLRLNDPPDWAGSKVYQLSPSAVENYVYETVNYGKGIIDVVEVFNEMNLPLEWGTSPTDPAAYVKLLAGAYRGAKRADPNVKVVAAAVSPRTGGLGGTMEDVDWLEGFYRAGGKDHFDVMGMHPYIGNYAPETPPSCTPMCFRTLELWRAVMEKYGDTKPGFITEVGTLEQSSNHLGPYEWMELPADKRADYLVRAIQLANANYPWLIGVMVFNLDYATTPWNPPSAERYWFSLLNADKSPRQAYNAFKQARQNGTLP